jgi:selenide,water dikinase
LVLTKPLGLGIITTAAKNNEDRLAAIGEAIRLMTTLNRGASEAALRSGARALTDVTGFGLLGHLRNVTAASGVTAEIWLDRVPVLPAAAEYVRAGIAPGGTHANWRFLSDWVSYEGIAKEEQLLLCDAQTSGGLLIAVAAAPTPTLVRELEQAGAPCAAVIGRVTSTGDGRIRVTRHATEQTCASHLQPQQ